MTAKRNLRTQLLDVSQDYLGPAAGRFVDRQIETHLEKKPEELTKEDLRKLIDWLELSFSMLTKDGKMVDEYVRRLTKIINGRSAA